jgi:hypothetical protein
MADTVNIVDRSRLFWDDLQVGINNLKFPGANYPDDTTYAFGIGGGVAFPVLGFAVGEYIFFDVQTSHSMKLSTILDNHIHFILPNTTTIGNKFKFQLDVIGAGVNAQFAVPSGSPYSGEHTVAANDNTHHRILDIGDIAAINTSVSTIYKCKLTRVAASADEYGSDVYLLFTDCHYQKDQIGSRTEYTK